MNFSYLKFDVSGSLPAVAHKSEGRKAESALEIDINEVKAKPRLIGRLIEKDTKNCVPGWRNW